MLMSWCDGHGHYFFDIDIEETLLLFEWYETKLDDLGSKAVLV